MAAGDVHRELAITGEPFCKLLGMTVRQKNPFVLPLSIHALTHLYCTPVSPGCRELFVITNTLIFFIQPTVSTNKVFMISNIVSIIGNNAVSF